MRSTVLAYDCAKSGKYCPIYANMVRQIGTNYNDMSFGLRLNKAKRSTKQQQSTALICFCLLASRRRDRLKWSSAEQAEKLHWSVRRNVENKPALLI